MELIQMFLRAGMILLAALYMPARIFVSNLDKFPHPERLAVLVFAYWLAGYLLYLVMARLTRQTWAATTSGAILALLLGSGGTLATRVSSVIALFLVLAISIGVGLVLARFSNEIQRRVGLFIMILVVAGPGSALIGSWDPRDDVDAVNPVSTPLPKDLRVSPDIYLIVLDGFPGQTTLESVYRHPIRFNSVPAIQRFDAWASYPVTLASAAAILEMGNLLPDGATIDTATRSRLEAIISGDNRLMNLLSRQGYRTHLIESGWSRSICGDKIDVCVPSSFFDEGIFETVRQSVVGEFIFRRVGSGLTAGVVHTMAWLSQTLPELAVNDQPDFVLASVLLPHPPLMLDSSCALVPEAWRGGNSLYLWDGAIEQRLEAYIEQTKCAAEFERQLLEHLPGDPLVVVMSDHGGDSTGQLSLPDHRWTDAEIVERMNVHLAIRSPLDCSLQQPVFIAAVMWSHLWCMSETSPGASFQPEMFIADRVGEPKILRLRQVGSEHLRRLGVLAD